MISFVLQKITGNCGCDAVVHSGASPQIKSLEHVGLSCLCVVVFITKGTSTPDLDAFEKHRNTAPVCMRMFLYSMLSGTYIPPTCVIYTAHLSPDTFAEVAAPSVVGTLTLWPKTRLLTKENRRQWSCRKYAFYASFLEERRIQRLQNPSRIKKQ